MTDPVAKLELVTRDPLKVGERQSLALRITSQGNDEVYVVFPLGDAATDLMSRDEFEACDFSQEKPVGVRALEPLPDDSCFSVGFNKVDKLFAFEVSLENFLVGSEPGSVDITLHTGGPKTRAADTTTVVKQSTPLRIEAFSAEAYNVIRGRRVPLSWKLSEEADYELIDAAKPGAPLKKGRGTSGSSDLPGLPGGDYLLRALVGGAPVAERRLRVHAFGATGFDSYELNLDADPAPTDILGLYVYDDRLYALLRAGTGERCAQLWSTDHGFDPDRPAWRPEVNALGETITLTLEAARRPGAVLKDRLWLLGGDCCDPDAPGTAVGYYDFQETAWHDVVETDLRRWPAEMAGRMGHAVVAAPTGDRLWVMGGWSQDGGACGDIWEFNGRADETCWTPRGAGCDVCLFGATAAADAVWRVGGFSDPGGKARLTATRYDANWAASDVDVSIAPGAQYCASALIVLDPRGIQPSGLGTVYAAKEYQHDLFFFGEERGATIQVNKVDGASAQGVLMERDYYHIQAAVFQGAAFFRALLPDRDAAGSLNMSYLVKVERSR